MKAICCAALKIAIKYLQIRHYPVTDFQFNSAFMSQKHPHRKKKKKEKKPRHIICQSILINHLERLGAGKSFNFYKNIMSAGHQLH